MDVEDKYQNEKDDGIVDFDDLSFVCPNCKKKYENVKRYTPPKNTHLANVISELDFHP